MNMRSFDTEIDLSKVTMPSFVISDDSHVDEPAEAWASMRSELRD